MIVEGQGDAQSFPHLAGKIAGWLGVGCYVSNPIRCGGWPKLRRPNGLETLAQLAASRPGCERIVIAVDLDDDCPVDELAHISQRLDAVQEQIGKTIQICFAIREFESWLLASLDTISQKCPEYNWKSTAPVENHSAIRDAKGRLRELMDGEYGETTDQQALVKGVDPPLLYSRDRSFRHLVKALAGLDYIVLEAAL